MKNTRTAWASVTSYTLVSRVPDIYILNCSKFIQSPDHIAETRPLKSLLYHCVQVFIHSEGHSSKWQNHLWLGVLSRSTVQWKRFACYKQRQLQTKRIKETERGVQKTTILGEDVHRWLNGYSCGCGKQEVRG